MAENEVHANISVLRLPLKQKAQSVDIIIIMKFMASEDSQC